MQPKPIPTLIFPYHKNIMFAKLPSQKETSGFTKRQLDCIIPLVERPKIDGLRALNRVLFAFI